MTTITEVPQTNYSNLRERTRRLAKMLDKRYDPPADETRSPLTIYKVTSLNPTDGVVNISEDDGVTELPVRHLGSYDPVVNDPVMVYKNGADWLVLGSVKRGQDIPDIPPPRDFTTDPIVPSETSGVIRDFTVNPIILTELANNSVNVNKIVDGAVDRVKIAEAAINAALIDVGAITETKIATDAVTTPKIATNSIITDHLNGRIVAATNIIGGTITAFEIASRTITADRIAVNSLTATEIATGAILIGPAGGTSLVQYANGYDPTTKETPAGAQAKADTAQSNATSIAQSFTQTYAEPAIVKQSTAPTPASNILWLDTSVTPNIMKRWNGSAWVDASPTTAAHVGAETQIHKGTTAPADTTKLWLDTSTAVNVLKRWNGSTWVKATPTLASEVGAETPAGAQTKATTAQTNAQNYTDTTVSPINTQVNLWKYPSTTFIDGGQIFTNTILANAIVTSELTATTITLGNDGVLAGTGWQLDQNSLAFWDNPTKQGDPSIYLDAATGSAVFKGMVDGGLIRNVDEGANTTNGTITYPTSAVVPTGTTRIWGTSGSSPKYPVTTLGGYGFTGATANVRYGLRVDATVGAADTIVTGRIGLMTQGNMKGGVYVRGSGTGTTLDANNGYYCEVIAAFLFSGPNLFYHVRCSKVVSGVRTIFATKTIDSGTQSQNGVYENIETIGISAIGSRIKFLFRGSVIHEVTDGSLTSGHAGMTWYSTTTTSEDIAFGTQFDWILPVVQGQLFIEDGMLWSGHENYASAPFKLNASGAIEGPSQALKFMRTGASQSLYMSFFDSDGSTRTGFIGHGSGAQTDMYIQSDASNVRLNAASGSFVIAGAIYASTTASAANVHVQSGGILLRSTSSKRYKRDIRSITDEEADRVLDLRPVRFRSIATLDRTDWTHYGLIAEEVADVDPRLVSFAEDEDDSTLRPEGVQYDRLVPHLINVARRQRDELDDLRARINALETA